MYGRKAIHASMGATKRVGTSPEPKKLDFPRTFRAILALGSRKVLSTLSCQKHTSR